MKKKMTAASHSTRSREIWVFLALAALVLPAGSPGAADAPVPDPREMQTLSSLASLIISCDAYRLDHGSYPGPTDGFVTAASLAPHLSPAYIRELPTLDAWGGPLRYATDGTRIAVLSYGADGVADREYLSLDTLEQAEGAGDDLVWSGGRLVVCPAHVCHLERLGNQKRTMADLRSIATAVEAYAIDERRYPGPTEGYVPVATIRPRVEPAYIRTLPLADEWGHTLLYWSDGEHYRIASPGSDGNPDRPFDQVVAGTRTATFTSDIVFGDGLFLQWPEGPQQ